MKNISNYSYMEKNYFIDNLDRAIKEEWIRAYHQPLVRAANGQVSDEEAFSRWDDPENGIFMASEFVPILHEAGLIYKLDLYMVERVLKKLKVQTERGYFLVPESVNLSGSDFRCCDMVSEVIKLVDSYGFTRDRLSIEISEKDMAADIDFMKEQVDRLRSAGFNVWMDDYGSGYASMLILLKVHFDLLKIDQTFVSEIDKSDAGKIIVTELIKTALALGMDTVAEGVETKSQVDFLKEIGCTKLQGYYYSKPNSWADILSLNLGGVEMDFENPEESEYYEALGRVNLYDLAISRSDDKDLSKYFDTLPMAVFELDDEKAIFVRCNKSYREFVKEYFSSGKSKKSVAYDSVKPGVGYYSFNAMRQCARTGERAIIDDRTADGLTIQMLLRRIAVNPVTGMAAVAVAVLSTTDIVSSEGLTYNYVARALSEDYIRLYFVDMDVETFAEYTPDGENRDITFKKLGDKFFDLDREAIDLEVYSEDFEAFKNEFTKENVTKQIRENGQFSMVTRLLFNKEPVYVSIKGVKTRGDRNHIIIGINNVDNQIKSREIVERAKEARIVYSRIGALTGNFIFIFTIDPISQAYTMYNPGGNKTDMNMAGEGENFFADVLKNADKGIYEEDLDSFLTAFTRENIYDQIMKTGMFENEHRAIINGKPRYVEVKATLTDEDGEEKLIVGILDVDEQIRREQEYARSLNAAEVKANLDELTGIKNKHAYVEMENILNAKIKEKYPPTFAICVFDLNGLKQINDTLGHQAGDKFIKRGCDIICRIFKHSPAYRVGGDEFVVIAQGYDYLNLDSLMSKMRKHNIKNQMKGDVVIAAGMSRFKGGETVARVFERADEEMYKNKRELKKAFNEQQ